MNTMLYKNPMLSGRPDGVHLFQDTLDSVQGEIIAEIEGGQPIGVLGIYDKTIKNIAVDKKHKIILKLLLGIAKKHGALRVEETFAPDIADYVYNFYTAEPAPEPHTNCAAELIRETAPGQISIQEEEQQPIPAQVRDAIDAIQILTGVYQGVSISVGAPTASESNKYIIPIIISMT